MRSTSPRRGAAPRLIVACVVLAAVLIGVLVLFLRADAPHSTGPRDSVIAVAPSAVAELSSAPAVELDGGDGPGAVRSGGIATGVRLRGPGKLEGAVTDRANGQGVGGAVVELLPLPPAGTAFLGRLFRLFSGSQGLSQRVRPIAVVLTGPDGRFRFEGVRTGTYFLDARGDHHVPEAVLRARVLASGAGGPVQIWMNAGGRVLGRVLLPDGSPASGATLALVPGPNNFLTTLSTGDMRWLETKSDAQGEFVIPGVPVGDGFEITATGAGFAISHLTDVTVKAGQDTQVVVQTRAGGSITGRVLAARDDGDPVPLPGAMLGAVPRGLRNLRCVEDVLRATQCTTAADGSYVMQRVPPGDVDVVAIERTHLPAIGARATLSDATTFQADDIVLKRGAMIAGRVVDGRGAAVPGVELRFNLVDWRNFQFDFSLAPMMAQAVEGFDLPKTDAEGRFLAGPIAGDPPYEVTFTKIGFAEAKLVHDPEKSPGEVVVTMQRGGAVEGVVMDAARGEPVATFSVGGGDLVDVDADAPGAQNPFSGGETVEDATGRFRVESVRPGTATLVFRAPGYLAESVDVEVVEGETKKGLIVQMTPGGVVRGTVVDAEGTPVVGAQVVAQASGASSKAREQRRERQRRSGLGRNDGTRRGGPPTSPFEPMMQGGADAVDDIPPGFLSMAAGMGMLGDRAAATDAKGRFELVGVEAGSFRVHAFHREHSAGSSDQKTMPAEGVLENVLVELQAGGSIVGTVSDRFGRPVPDEIVMAFSPAAFGGPGDGGAASGGAYQGSTDEQGRYAIRHVGAGSYFLVATRGDEDLNPATFFGTLNFDLVTVPDGEEVEFDLIDGTAAACKVRGVVTYRGEPRARGNLVATSTDTESLLGVEFRAAKMLGDGRFEFAGLAPGIWQLQFDGDGPRVRTSIEVPDLPEVDVEVRLPEGGVEGRVVDDRTNEPIAGVQVTLRRISNAPQAKGLLGSMVARDAGVVRNTTNETGEFTFERLESGDYEIVARTPSWRRENRESYAPGEPARLEVDGQRVERGVVLRLLPSLSITGRVRGGEEPIANVRVVAIREGAGMEGVESAQSDADGRFTIRGLAPGKYRLSGNVDGWAEGRKDGVEVVRGREMGDVEIVLTKGVLVRVRVTKDGLPVSGARAQLLAPGGEAAGSDPGRAIEGFFRGEGASDTEGMVEIGRFAPGKYRLEAQRGASKGSKEVTIDGRDAETELRIDVR